MMHHRLFFRGIVAIGLYMGLQIATIPLLPSVLWAGNHTSQRQISPARLEAAINSSAAYLTRACRSNGKFTYRINTNPDTPIKPRYNLLRHAGAIYAMASYLQSYPQASTRDALIRASAFLKDIAIAPLPQNLDLLAVWSHPEITGSKKPLQAKLGGTGLGLVALLSVEEIIPGTTPVEYLRKMGNFLLFMQKNDGSFFSKFIPERGGKDASWESLYYPGEAALGLLMLYEKDPALKWLQAAANSLAYLSRKRENQTQVEADHWALLATARLLPVYHHLIDPPLPQKAIEGHARMICESILHTWSADSASTTTFEGFTHDGRTTPTAVRLEGLLAALGFLPENTEPLRKRIVFAVNAGLVFLLNAQLRSGPYAGGMPRATGRLPENHQRFSSSFNRRVTEVRIDYVQHALSAMLQYKQHFF